MENKEMTDESVRPAMAEEKGPSPTAPRRLTLRKSAKLRHRSLVESLFSAGQSVYDFPLRLSWHYLTEDELRRQFRDTVPAQIGPLQILITVPKKKRRHAVDRVYMRRRIREAFRLHNDRLRERVEADPNIRTLSMAFIYLHNENLPYSDIERKIIRLLRKIERRLWSESSGEDTATASDNEVVGKKAEVNRTEEEARE